MLLRVNPLPYIRAWLDKFSYHDSSDMSREDLRSWLDTLCVQRRVTEEEAELLLDCLAAAGIGREAEQTRTVYCACTAS